jgi:hypothetical protein
VDEPTQVADPDIPATGLEGPVATASGLPVEPILPTSEAELARWRARITASREIRDAWRPVWEAALDKCQPPPKDLGDSRDPYDVNPHLHYRTIRQKCSSLWAVGPEIVLEARAQEQQEALVATHAAALNLLLGPAPDGVGAAAVMAQNVLDALTVGGMGWARIGWDRVTVALPPPDDLMGMAGEQPIPVPIYEAPTLKRIKPGAGLVPADAEGADSDLWPWIGAEYGLPVAEARRVFNIPEGVEIPTTDQPIGSVRNTRAGRRGVREAHVIELHYYASRERADVAHPKLVYELVLIEGIEQPVRHRPCPYQAIDPATGLLTADSVDGFSFDTLVLRDEAEGAIGASDAVLITPLAEEVATFRSQMLRHRDASIPIVLFKESAIDAVMREKIRANDYFNWVVVADTEWPAGREPIMLATSPTLSRDSFTSQDYLERDIQQAVGSGDNQTGATTKTRRSATEIQTIGASIAARESVDRARVAACYVRRARKLDAILRRYHQAPLTVQVIGPQGYPMWAPWVAQAVPGPMRYSMRQDSQIFTDAASNQARHLQLYNQTANDPGANRAYLLRNIFKAFGQDTTQAILPPQPPAPPQPKISASVKMDDFMTPAAIIAGKLLTGQPITPEDLALVQSAIAQLPPAVGASPEAPMGQPEHGGVAEKTEPIDAHQSRRTGGMEGVGVV